MGYKPYKRPIPALWNNSERRTWRNAILECKSGMPNQLHDRDPSYRTLAEAIRSRGMYKE